MVIVEKRGNGDLPEAFEDIESWGIFYGIPLKVVRRVTRALFRTGAFKVPNEEGSTTIIYLVEAHPNL